MKCGIIGTWSWVIMRDVLSRMDSKWVEHYRPITLKVLTMMNTIKATGRYKLIVNKMLADHITSENRNTVVPLMFDLEIDNSLPTTKLYIVGGEDVQHRGEMNIEGLQ